MMENTPKISAFNQQLFDELIKSSREFTDVIEKETAYLKNHQLDQALSLLSQKRECAGGHQDLILTCSEQWEWKLVPAPQMEMLREVFDRLSCVLTENEKMLKLVHTVHEGVMTEVTKMICQDQAPVCQYTKNRRQTMNKSPVSMAVMNKTV